VPPFNILSVILQAYIFSKFPIQFAMHRGALFAICEELMPIFWFEFGTYLQTPPLRQGFSSALHRGPNWHWSPEKPL
jgi:hypothetical protein